MRILSMPVIHLLTMLLTLGLVSACASKADPKETQTTAQVKSIHASRMALQTNHHIMFASLESYDGDLRKQIRKGDTVTLIHHDGHAGDFDAIRLKDGSVITLDSQ